MRRVSKNLESKNANAPKNFYLKEEQISLQVWCQAMGPRQVCCSNPSVRESYHDVSVKAAASM